MSDVLAPGQKCGPYTIVREVGRGAMGVVYQAKSPEGEDRAIKTLILKMRMKGDLLERFKREITLLSYIDHVNVVHFYEAGMIQVGGTPTLWVALEFLEGPTLRQIIHERKTPLWADRIARLSRQIAEGVTQAHELKVIHRDLKPENVIVSKGDIIKVYDFGIAKFKAQGVKTTGMHDRYGTLRYMAPEQIGGENVDARTDVYALGLMMHEMATGVHPFGALDKALEQDSLVMKQLTETPRPVHEVVSGFPRELSDIIAKAQEKRPEDRFDDMSALHAALKGFLQRQAAEKRQFALGPAAESDVARNAQEWEQRLSSTNSDIVSSRRESATPGSGSDGRSATPIPSGPATPANMPAVSPSAPPVAPGNQGAPAGGPPVAAPRAALATPPQGGFRAGPATVAIDESPELAALQAPFKAMGPTAPMLAVPEQVKAFAARGPLPMAPGAHANVPAATAQLADAPIPRGGNPLPFTAAPSASDASRALGDTTSSNFRLVQTIGKPPAEQRKDGLSGKALAFLAFGALAVGIGVVLVGWLATRQPKPVSGDANAGSADSAQEAAGANAAGAGNAVGASSRGESEHAGGATGSSSSGPSASAESSAGSDASTSTSSSSSAAVSASVASEESAQSIASSAASPARTSGGTTRPNVTTTTTKTLKYVDMK